MSLQNVFRFARLGVPDDCCPVVAAAGEESAVWGEVNRVYSSIMFGQFLYEYTGVCVEEIDVASGCAR
jgi:hypothetical protein